MYDVISAVIIVENRKYIYKEGGKYLCVIAVCFRFRFKVIILRNSLPLSWINMVIKLCSKEKQPRFFLLNVYSVFVSF